MKLGIQLGYWGLGLTRQDQLDIVQEAERLGYDSVFAAEAYGSDAVTILGWLAGQTSTIKLGSAIMQMPARSAAMTAMTAATLDNLSDGRFILGIGSSGPQVAEGWHGQRFGKQLKRTREYVAVVRKALARERLEFHGETIELPLPDGPGKALKLTIAPVQESIPIYIAAIGPNNTRLVGEIGDGLLPMMFSPEHADVALGSLWEGIETSGRQRSDVKVCPSTNFHIGEDPGQAAESMMRGVAALYVGGMGSREKNFYNAAVSRYGFEDAAKEVQDLFLEGKRAEAMAAIPHELLDAINLVGTREHVTERLRAFEAAGVDTLIVTPATTTRDGRIAQLRELAAAAEAV
ncbi:LLM class F420-dependent oxidoreductase [Patulibacter americanus]|jgi:F420-dependent oxidoreductase-like protein|uniref:LLM class F420-dependent oxidoreductase n=1 Tax=Patulibacter americanus TaxID=588672 RepID=UPI0003B33DF8|nr:LLM class F420-dependent oxidoreductase [Patulibacter americanus]